MQHRRRIITIIRLLVLVGIVLCPRPQDTLLISASTTTSTMTTNVVPTYPNTGTSVFQQGFIPDPGQTMPYNAPQLYSPSAPVPLSTSSIISPQQPSELPNPYGISNNQMQQFSVQTSTQIPVTTIDAPQAQQTVNTPQVPIYIMAPSQQNQQNQNIQTVSTSSSQPIINTQPVSTVVIPRGAVLPSSQLQTKGTQNSSPEGTDPSQDQPGQQTKPVKKQGGYHLKTRQIVTNTAVAALGAAAFFGLSEGTIAAIRAVKRNKRRKRQQRMQQKNHQPPPNSKDALLQHHLKQRQYMDRKHLRELQIRHKRLTAKKFMKNQAKQLKIKQIKENYQLEKKQLLEIQEQELKNFMDKKKKKDEDDDDDDDDEQNSSATTSKAGPHGSPPQPPPPGFNIPIGPQGPQVSQVSQGSYSQLPPPITHASPTPTPTPKVVITIASQAPKQISPYAISPPPKKPRKNK